MRKSTESAAPGKPRADFPLFVHKTGRWCKKVRQKFVYFGRVADDPTGDAALAKWLDERDELLAGRTPRKRGDGLTVAALANEFLTDRKNRMDAGELAPRTFSEYFKCCERVIATFGRNRCVDDLNTSDFAGLRASLAKTRGPVALGNEVQRVRTLFKHGFDNGLMDRPIRYGTSFDKPPAKSIRKAKAAAGPMMFSADELQKILAKADIPLTAMILLGINSALGAADLASMPIQAVDLEGGWLDFARVKTGVPRRAKLWPETVAELRKAIAARPKAKDPADADLVFITPRGKRWVQLSTNEDVAKWAARQDLVSHAFRKLAVSAGITAKRGFYCLRRTHQTIAEKSGDFPAVSHVMGHAPRLNDMSATYRQQIADDRLEAVAAAVRHWLYGPEIPTKKAAKVP